LSSKPLIFWFGGQKSIFTVKKFMKSQESLRPKVVKITSWLVKLYDFTVNMYIPYKIGLKTRKLATSIILGQIDKLGPSLWVWQKWKINWLPSPSGHHSLPNLQSPLSPLAFLKTQVLNSSWFHNSLSLSLSKHLFFLYFVCLCYSSILHSPSSMLSRLASL